MKKRSITRWVSLLTIGGLLCTSVAVDGIGLAVSADETAQPTASVSTVSLSEDSYSEYAKSTEMELASSDGTIASVGATLSEGDETTVAVTVPADGLYEWRLFYRSLEKRNTVMAMDVDGRLPFSEASTLSFPSYWVNDGDVRKDALENEFAPEQTLYEKAVEVSARDYSGRYEMPYRFALTAGEHTVHLRVVQGAVDLQTVCFVAPAQTAAYASPKKVDTVEEYVVLEGEKADLKNERSLIPLSDNDSAAVYPSSPSHSRLNYIGGSNWSTPGSALTWNFHVDTAGYYTVEFLFRQSELLGGVSFRHMAIDGKAPFAEAERIRFPYASGWQDRAFGDDDPYYIWLDAGDHTLTLTATAGQMAEIYSAMQTVTATMGNLYVDITMIVGETVDIYRSYELFNQIPSFQDTLDEIITQLDTVCNKIESMQETKSGSMVSTMRNTQRVVQQMRDNPYSAHRYKSQFYDGYTNLSALMGTMADMPLDIDRIVIAGANAKVERLTPNLFGRMSFVFRRFVSTFTANYRDAAVDSDQENLTLWITWGRDQAQVLNAMIQDDFVRKTGIPVSVQLVNASLVQAILAGSGPDCMLQMVRTEPVNLAMRGALTDLRQFDDLDTVLQCFVPDAEKPYEYNNGLYALPDTQTFYLMYMRTDILNSMGLKAPKTWEEYINTAMLLQRSNLQAYIPYTRIADSGASNTGVGGMSLFPTLLAQNGLSLYKEDRSASTLTDVAQVQLFNNWINWYVKYKIPTVMDFYNRFRIGSAPLGIAPYTLYTQLKAAAPEIDGRWTVATLPGTMRADGRLDITSAGAGAGCAITTLSKNPQNAWTFLKWWTDAQTQLRFSESLESILGYLGRVTTANTEALESMDWDSNMLQTIRRQRQSLQEIPEVPGGYYTARGIDQAFWGVVEQGEVATDSLTKWGAVVDREIARKTAEYAPQQ